MSTNKSELISVQIAPNLPMDIICNGFSIKETIMSVLKKYDRMGCLDYCPLDDLAEDLKEAFAIKLRLKQGAE